jgi:5-methylcytosine-specific restriction endonuclease McrA
VRDPRPGLGWSLFRVAIRARYASYMASEEWSQRRERWLAEYRAANGGANPTCAICGAPWELGSGDLHHRSYRRLGAEHWIDLIALCRVDHQRLHMIMEQHPAWRRLPREQATDLIAARLRAITFQEGGHARQR